MSAELRLGPMLRHVSETTATVWVETSAPGTVTVVAGDAGGGRREVAAATETFTVHGHHYALCDLRGLSPGSVLPYRVLIDGAQVWPPPGSPRPPSRVRTLSPEGPAQVMFGSCRLVAGHSPADNQRHGVDVLRAHALRLARREELEGGPEPSPGENSVLLLIGDQVYADELQPPMAEFLRRRRARLAADRLRETEPPEDEVVFFEEYAELYRQAWSDPDVRWLLSTVPTLMLFDDHDIRDDWNTSGAWRRRIAEQPWWRTRVTSGLGAYWIYQHLGNLSPELRAEDPVFPVVAAEGRGVDAAEAVDAFAWRAHEEPGGYRWSHRHDIGRTRLLMVDSRCGRAVEDDRERRMLAAGEWAWVDRHLTGEVDHLVLASTLPFLLPASIHYLEAWNEAVCAGAWGSRARGPAEKLRQAVDLEHWPAFQASFTDVSRAVLEVAAGRRGTAPASVLFLGGDVHFSYLARARPRRGGPEVSSAIAQLVSSPLRNPLGALLRSGTWTAARRATVLGARALARLAGVRAPVLRWALEGSPYYGNVLATLSLEDRRAEVVWEHARALAPPDSERVEWPQIREVARHRLTL